MKVKIGGLQKVSFSDYPGMITAIIFTQGCNFRCPYCHNPELADPARYSETLSAKGILAFLELRKGNLDAVTISGGEPTLQPDLLPFLRKIREFGYLIKVDTNGSRPDVLATLYEAGLVDYLAMDIKGPLEKYSFITKSNIHLAAVCKSIELIMASGVGYEFRTTAVKSLLQTEDFTRIAALIKPARRFVLQSFVPSKALEGQYLSETPFTRSELEEIGLSMQKDLPCVLVQ